MELFLTAILILAAAALVTALLAALASFCPPSAANCRTANCLGSCCAALGCLTGLCAVAVGPWDATLILELPWGLPAGALVLGLDPLSRIFLLPVFGLGMVCAVSGGLSLRHTSPREHNLGALVLLSPAPAGHGGGHERARRRALSAGLGNHVPGALFSY